jgi:hypothetical protein
VRKHRTLLFVVCCLALTTLAFAETNQDTTVAPTVRHPIRFAVSPPMSAVPQLLPSPDMRVHEVRSINRALGPGAEDTAVQTEFGPLLNGTPGIDFEGIGFNIDGEPSDVNLAVGPNHIVQIVNSEWAVYDKTGLIFPGFPKSLGSIWTGLGGACTGEQGDPIAQYDRLADRWFLSQIGSAVAPFSLCIAVSKSNDPTGAYSLYEYSFGNNLPDYPHYSVWPTATNPAYLQMAHLFLNPQTFVGTAACAYDRTAMLAGKPSPVQICFTIQNDGGFLPSDLDGSTPPPAGSPGYFITFETSSLHEFRLTPNFANPAGSTFTGPINIPVSAFSLACGGTGGACVRQLGTAQQLDTVGDRMMYRLAYRNFGDHEALVVNHTVANGASGAPRWYEIRTPNSTPTIFQQGTFAPNATFRWMGSMAMDRAGDMLMSYSVSSSSIDPGIAYTGRVPGDALGTMESENILLTGTHFQEGHNRWGDYSAMRIDPADDCTFWFTNQYLKTDGDFVWATHIGSFAFTGCGPDFTIKASPSSLTIPQGGSGTSGITVTSLSGFNLATTLDASGLPSGVTAAFATNPVTPPANGKVTSTLTLTASNTATTGTATVTITGTSGSVVHTTTIALTVHQGLTVSVTDPPAANPGQSTATTMQIATTDGNLLANNVTYTCSAGLPAGATCSFLPLQLDAGTSGGSVTITVQTTGPFTGLAGPTHSGPQHKLRGQNQRLWLPLSLPLASMVFVGLAGRSLPRRYKIVGLCLTLALTGLLVACGGGGSSSPPPPPPPPPPISVSVTPNPVNTLFPNLNANGTQAPPQVQLFKATVNNSTNQSVNWEVNGVVGGNATFGTIDTSGNYAAPATLPSPPTFNVTAVSQADTSKSGNASVTIQTPTPPVTSKQITVTVTEGTTVQRPTFHLTVN